MRKLIRCGQLFTASDERAVGGQALLIEDGIIIFAGAEREVPRTEPIDEIVDFSRWFVMPGLTDAHVHLSYGNATHAEELDLYPSVEFRALRGLVGSQRMLLAGYTSLADPSTTGNVSLAIRDAIDAGLFVGPRISTAGRAILTAQGVDYFYPRWVRMPETSVAFLIRNVSEGIAEIRQEIKDGVDFIKIAIDGDELVTGTGLVSGLTQEETSSLVCEIHRLGRKVAIHARGAEGIRYAAHAGADFILHGSWIDDEAIEAALRNRCALCPTLSLLANTIEFTRPTDAAYAFVEPTKRELDAAITNLRRAKAAGIPFMAGSEAGFAVTPYGEWPARELEYYVKYLGFTPAEAIISATRENARIVRDSDKYGTLETGKTADLLALDSDPLADISILQDRSRIKSIMLGGEPVSLKVAENPRRLSSEMAHSFWGQIYTRARARTK